MEDLYEIEDKLHSLVRHMKDKFILIFGKQKRRLMRCFHACLFQK